MTMSVGKIIRKSLLANAISILQRSAFNGNRFLYTRSALGVNGYVVARTSYKKQFTNLEESFRTRMHNFLETSDSVIFSEDLKAMLYIMEKTPEDYDLTVKMIKRYNEQKKQLRFSNFTFGPVIMRALYHLDEPDLAFQLYKDPELEEFFDQLMSVQILMDLLFNHQKYEQCLEAYKLFTNKPMSNIVYPKNSAVIALAACYKQNTKESLDMAIDIFKHCESKFVELPRRALVYGAYLALKQNRPEIAMELICKRQHNNARTSRCIKALAYCKLKRFDDLTILLKKFTYVDSLPERRTFFRDVIEEIEEAVKAADLTENSELVSILNYIKESGLVENMTINEFILQEIGGEERDKLQNMKRKNISRFHNIVNTSTSFGVAKQ